MINESDQEMKKVINSNLFITFTGSVWLQVGTALVTPLANKIQEFMKIARGN